MITRNDRATASGVALLAVLFALTLLALLALPFAVSMGVGAEAATRDVEKVQAEQASASVRDLLLSEAAWSHPVFDPTPNYDSLAEFVDRIELPKKFSDLQEDGKVLLGGQVWDLQRFLGLDSVSPLALGNLIGTTTRLKEPLLPDATSMELETAEALPESGMIWVAHELIRYQEKQDNTLQGLQRALYHEELLFADGKSPIDAGVLVFDWRCVMAVAWPFLGRGTTARQTRRPYASVSEFVEIAGRDPLGSPVGPEGVGGFSTAELDVLQESLSVDTMATTAATWGRPERVFNKLEGGKSKSVRIKNVVHIGGGSTVRLRNLRTGTVEYALVMRTMRVRNTADLSVSSVNLELLLPVLQSFPDIDTVVEPLVPAPVNVNTASAAVLTALFSEVRQAPGVDSHSTAGVQGRGVLGISRSQARELADAIATLRSAEPGSSTPGGVATGPLEGWRDFVERLMKPRLDAASSQPAKTQWIVLYRNLLTGRDGTVEMGTAPITFASGPWVGYRAAASRSRSTVAPGVASRHERTGLAAAMPGLPLERAWNTQEVLEDAFQLDRRAPFWITTPVNLGPVLPDDPSNDPASRHFAHVVPIAYPDFGFGEARFPAKDEADSGFRPACSRAPSGSWGQTQVPVQHGVESFATRLDPRGHDVSKDGPYLVRNTGPRGGRAGAGQGSSTGNRHELSFPFANGDGFMDRLGASFWLEPKSLEGVTLFDHGGGDPERNRLSLQGKDGKLVLEVIGEEGLDPDPSQSPAGVERTAVEWSLPLAELGLPADTPLHVNFGAYAGRPSDLSVAIDGMTRGKARYTTYLTAGLKVFDPQLRAASNSIPGTRGDERYVDLQVESTEGFPPMGVLRIGLELFEYTGISGNTFQCQWKDSFGGRGARQSGREFRPDIPVDSSGKPTIDFNDPSMQGVNLDVYPAHPAGSLVELYGYSSLLSEDSPMMDRETQLATAIGGWAVARAFIDNPRPIAITPQGGPTVSLGAGIDANWAGELQLASPVPTGRTQPPPAGQSSIVDAFPTTGGYALLIQRYQPLEAGGAAGQPTSTALVGGIEVIRYTSRQGNKLTGIQRGQRLPGQDEQIDRDVYDGSARQFVTDWEDWQWGNDPTLIWDDIPTLIVWVVPVTIPIVDTSCVWNPEKTGLTEWVQLYPRGGDPDDTEWVRYDAIADNQHLVRANRRAWDRVYESLVWSRVVQTIRVGPLGPNATPPGADAAPPWPPVQATSDYIGYVPQVESSFPQIYAARHALQFRGDPLPGGPNNSGTSSHAHSNSIVTPCHRLQLSWGNYGALTGRVGRHDRVAIIDGSEANGSTRPQVEWHTVNWQWRRYGSDVLQQNQSPPERLGPWPFQLVAFTDGVQSKSFLGPPRNTVVTEPRKFDRVVKFPSGELPAAYCENVAIGGGVGNTQPMQGFVDEVEVMNHIGADLMVDEAFTAAAKTFRINRAYTYTSAGPFWSPADLTQTFPRSGGLLLIDNEILAYQSHADGQFTVATNGRGLLNTEPKDHDQGARVHFLTHRPAAILAGGVGNRDTALPLQALGAMPPAGGTALLGRELLHYTWVRTEGDKITLEMPRWVPPGESDTTAGARGLFRGRFGTPVQSGSSGEPVIMFPFRYWDRYFERSDDPELAYFQLTSTETPVFYRTLRWREETQDARVGVVCLVRTDSLVPWDAVPGAAGLWQLRGSSASAPPHRIAAQASRIEIRFATEYRPGVLDLAAFREHGWKTTARVEDVRLEYEGQGRIFDEQVTAR